MRGQGLHRWLATSRPATDISRWLVLAVGVLGLASAPAVDAESGVERAEPSSSPTDEGPSTHAEEETPDAVEQEDRPERGTVRVQPGRAGFSGSGLTRLRRLHQQLLDRVSTRNWEGAERTLERVDELLEEDNPTRLRLHAWYAARRGRGQQAVALYERLLARFPDDEQSLLNLAQLHFAADRDRAGREVIRRARRRLPESRAVQRVAEQLGL